MTMKRQLVYLGGIVLTIFDIFFLIYITFYPVANSFKYQVIVFDLLLCAFFWIEFLYNLKKADDKRRSATSSTTSRPMLPVLRQ